MIEKLKQAFANSDWNTVDLILLPRDEAEAEVWLILAALLACLLSPRNSSGDGSST